MSEIHKNSFMEQGPVLGYDPMVAAEVDTIGQQDEEQAILRADIERSPCKSGMTESARSEQGTCRPVMLTVPYGHAQTSPLTAARGAIVHHQLV